MHLKKLSEVTVPSAVLVAFADARILQGSHLAFGTFHCHCFIQVCPFGFHLLSLTFKKHKS